MAQHDKHRTIMSERHADPTQWRHVRLPVDIYNALKIMALQWGCTYHQVLAKLIAQEQRDNRVRDYLARRKRHEAGHTYTEGQQKSFTL